MRCGIPVYIYIYIYIYTFQVTNSRTTYNTMTMTSIFSSEDQISVLTYLVKVCRIITDSYAGCQRHQQSKRDKERRKITNPRTRQQQQQKCKEKNIDYPRQRTTMGHKTERMPYSYNERKENLNTVITA